MEDQTHTIWNQRFMRQIIDSMADGVFIVDPKGKVSFWNPSMEKISGYSAKEALGKPCTLISCSGCTGVACKTGVEGCDIINNARSQTMEGYLKHKSGYDVPVIKKASAVHDDNGKFLGIVEAVTDVTELTKATQKAEEAAIRLGDVKQMDHIIGKSHEIQKVFTALKAAASSDATILIQGESGTGKELVASAIHYNSDRRHRPLVTVNCSALSESLLESELFGHVKGAYTGAIKDRIGRFEEAKGGTIFLDEIGELSPFIQVKLLRVLQEREIERVGDSKKRKVDIRVITATHRDLLGMVAEGTFREDLFYRLKVFPIKLPPLRIRKDDIPLLVYKFIEKMNKKTGKQVKDIDKSALKALLDYHWPGNVRELENAIEHAFVLCNSQLISMDELPLEIKEAEMTHLKEFEKLTVPKLASLQEPLNDQSEVMPLNIDAPSQSKKRKSKITKEELLVLLNKCQWNKLEVGRRIGVSHTAIWKYMKKWDIPLKKP
jgi:two-component system, NtrC family, response regulator HydG